MNAPHSPVLIVDDESTIRDTLRWLLEDAGYEAREAPDGMAAVELMTTSATPLVVLLDLKMPKLSGFDLVRLLVSKPAWAARPAFIVVTAVTAPFWPPDLIPLLQYLSITAVAKPFDIEDILAAVAVEVEYVAARTEPAIQ